MRWGGREVGHVWERRKGVCSHEPLFPSCVCATTLCVSQAENRKVRAKSESAPAATRHSHQLRVHYQVSFLSVLYCSLTHSVSFPFTHTHAHTRGRGKTRPQKNYYTPLLPAVHPTIARRFTQDVDSSLGGHLWITGLSQFATTQR